MSVDEVVAAVQKTIEKSAQKNKLSTKMHGIFIF